VIVYQLLAHGRWFSPGTPASSTTKTGRHDIAEILLKVALKTKNQSINHIGLFLDKIDKTMLQQMSLRRKSFLENKTT
jgi:guanylate kinase